MNYSLDYYHSIDMDWFGLDQNDNILRFTSSGGLFPKSIEANGESNSTLLSFLLTIPPYTRSLTVSTKMDQYIQFDNNRFKEKYVNDHASMAKRGIFSFDKSYIHDLDNYLYHKVASPVLPLKLLELPPEMRRILQKTRIQIDITETNQVSVHNFDD